MDRKRTIGYLLKGFGRTSETFISTEIALLEEAGLRLHVFSFLRLEGQAAHGIHQRIRAEVTYLPEVVTPSREKGGGGILAWMRVNWPRFATIRRALWRRHPWRYLRTLIAALRLGLDGLQRGEPAMRASLKEFLQACAIAEVILDESVRGSERQIAHLHAHFAHTATTVAMLAARLTGLPFSFTAHAKDIYRVDMNPGDLLRRKMVAARFIVTCTEANRAHLIAQGGDPTRIHRIYHGVDLTLFRAAPAEVGKGEERPGEPPLVLSVGRFVEKKGFPDLVEAIRRLREAGIDCRALIVGGLTPHAETVRAQIGEAGLDEVVTLQHAVPQEELRTIYQRASLFVLPCVITDDGDRDGIPNVLVEALAMGVPVVSTRISGIPELVEDGVTGRLVAPGDPAALAQAMRELLEDPAQRRQLADAGRARVDDLFDASRNVQALQRLLEGQDTQR